MAVSMRNVKNKINATRKTAQITNAMNMVSASKLKRAEHHIKNYLPFVEKVEEIISDLISSGEDFTHPLLTPREVKKTCYVLITSDRGLAGPFNNNLFKRIAELIDNHKEDEYVVAPLGSRGYNYVRKKKYNMLNDEMILLRDDINLDDIRNFIMKVITMYLQNKIDKVVIIYNHFINTLVQRVESKVLLPIENKFENNNNDIYIYEGGVESILDTILPLYIQGLIYGFVLDSKASEHASRMTAMKSATDNAREIISELELLYNRARQAEITSELTDIIGGANATNNS